MHHNVPLKRQRTPGSTNAAVQQVRGMLVRSQRRGLLVALAKAHMVDIRAAFPTPWIQFLPTSWL